MIGSYSGVSSRSVSPRTLPQTSMANAKYISSFLDPPAHRHASTKRPSRSYGIIIAGCSLVIWIIYSFSQHFPMQITAPTTTPIIDKVQSPPWIREFDLRELNTTTIGWKQSEHVLLCVPLRDAAQHLPRFFSQLHNLTYPHHLIDLAFLVSESSDSTLQDLLASLESLQSSASPFGVAEIFEQDFGQLVGQSFSDRHSFLAQGPRRKAMARARNWLWMNALKPYHSWVYWRDADIETAPDTIIEDLMRHDHDIITPSTYTVLLTFR